MDLESLNLQMAPYSKMKPMILFIDHATDELTVTIPLHPCFSTYPF